MSVINFCSINYDKVMDITEKVASSENKGQYMIMSQETYDELNEYYSIYKEYLVKPTCCGLFIAIYDKLKFGEIDFI